VGVRRGFPWSLNESASAEPSHIEYARDGNAGKYVCNELST